MSETDNSSFYDDETKPKKKWYYWFRENWFMVSTIIGVAIGFGAGYGAQQANLSPEALVWLAMPGDIYIRLLQLTILPMIIANIINVMAGLNPKENGKLSVITLVYILLCNLISSLIGIAYGYIIKPGETGNSAGSTGGTSSNESSSQISYIFRDLLLNIFPDNIVGVAIFQAGTDFENPTNDSNGYIVYNSLTLDGTNMIGILFCSFVFGVACNRAKEKGEAFKKFFASLGEVVMLLMQKFLLITPVGVLFMVLSSMAKVEDLSGTFKSLGLFIALNFVGQFTHFTLLMLSLVVLCVNPFRILRLCMPPYLISFATTSAIVSLPKCYIACDTYGVSKKISRFVLPLAGTMKSDASAVFIAGAVVFVSQYTNAPMNAGMIIITIILATAYVSALPNIPSASMVVVITIVNSIGINSTSAGLLFAVEWLNDRLRSGNVALSHMFCTAFVHHTCYKNIQEDDDDVDDYNVERDAVYDAISLTVDKN